VEIPLAAELVFGMIFLGPGLRVMGRGSRKWPVVIFLLRGEIDDDGSRNGSLLSFLFSGISEKT
jgi:hypothetical protein